MIGSLTTVIVFAVAVAHDNGYGCTGTENISIVFVIRMRLFFVMFSHCSRCC